MITPTEVVERETLYYYDTYDGSHKFGDIVDIRNWYKDHNETPKLGKLFWATVPGEKSKVRIMRFYFMELGNMALFKLTFNYLKLIP